MPPPSRSWAAVARQHASNSSTTSVRNPQLPIVTSTTPPIAASIPIPLAPPRVAFVSGHIDITASQFTEQYASMLNSAARNNDSFIVSTAKGVDTMALAYLRAQNVDPSRITIYLHSSQPNRKLDASRPHVNKSRPGADRGVEERYRKEGYNTRVIQGYHTARDAVMTQESDYDILWVRDESATKALYGSKYRPGRVSGTQKNKDRRLLKNGRTGQSSVT